MPIINCKVELRLKWKKYCVLSAAGADDNDTNSNNIIFIMNGTKLYIPVLNLSARDNQKLLERLSKGFERSVYWNEYKTKSLNKNMTNEYRYFLGSNFVAINRIYVLVYTNQDANAHRFNAQKYYLQKGIIKNYNITNGKHFYDQADDSDMKWYKEIRKLTTGQGENYTSGCLLDYDYIKKAS